MFQVRVGVWLRRRLWVRYLLLEDDEAGGRLHGARVVPGWGEGEGEGEGED